MKKLNLLIPLIAMGYLTSNSLAQNTESIPPKGIKTLIDNEHTSVVDHDLEPGFKSSLHTHPVYVLYALTECKLRIYPQGKDPSIFEMKKGEAVYGGPSGPHETEVLGNENCKFIRVDFKSMPYEEKD